MDHLQIIVEQAYHRRIGLADAEIVDRGKIEFAWKTHHPDARRKRASGWRVFRRALRAMRNERALRAWRREKGGRRRIGGRAGSDDVGDLSFSFLPAPFSRRAALCASVILAQV